ncbi:MAG: DUF4124 domain-containing protein [Gammaproteobacteria bacterium]|nr:DUF4124 domain-containing protein [Gammaproteobacteria bacterium]
MKLFGKLLIATLVIGLLLPFTILKGKDGKPLMSFSSLKMPEMGLPDVPSLPKSASTGLTTEAGSDSTVIYQWKDSSGSIQFTNSLPPEGVEYTVKGYDPDTNVIQSVKLPEETSEEEQVVQTEKKPPSEPDGLASVYSPEKVNKLIDDAKNVEKLLNDRLKQQNAIMGD